MRIAILTTDNRDHHRKYDSKDPSFGPAIEGILRGLATRPELEIHVISCTQKPMRSPEKLADNTWFHLLQVPKIGWLRTGYQGCIRAIRRKLREVQPNLVHGQGTERECALSAVFSGFPNVITIHGNMGAIARTTKAPIGSYWWWMASLERFTLPRTRGVFCNSRHTESLVQSRARKIWLVPNAIRREFFDIPFRERSTSSKPILLNVGTIAPLKRQLALLEVAEELHREGHSFEIHFVGPADPRNKYAADFLQRVRIAEGDGFARYLGTKTLPDLIETFDAASGLVHVPFEEAFGLVVAEGLARNLKFFGTHVGGLIDVADGVEDAELFPLQDRQSLRIAIANWLSAGCPRPESAAVEMRKRYHPDVIAARHEEIYREVLAGRSLR
jgi:glycosyltransferase involved in cell wall biosynthesis